MDLEQIDPDNRPALAAWHATVLEAETHGREDTATPWQLAEVEAQLRDQTDTVRLVVAGIENGRDLVVAGQIGMPSTHSRTHANVGVFTHPAHRRRGHGTRMLAHLETIARGHGRTVLNAETSWPYEGAADGTGTPGPEFLRARGFEFGLGNVMRTLDLPVDSGLLERLAHHAAARHAAYTLRSFVGPVPDDLAVGWADLVASLSVEAPRGALERERESAEVAELRRHEELIAAQGRTKYNTAAVASDGSVVAYTDLAVTRHDPENAFQWGTLVASAHRGHRLGLAVKTANLQLFQSSRQAATRLLTWNAEGNSHMVEVNDALGFRPVERLGEFQKRLQP